MTEISTSGSVATYTTDDAIDTRASGSSEVFTVNRKLAFRGYQPLWLADAMARIDGLSQLSRNWDSYGALAVEPITITAAKEVLRQLANVDTVDCPVITANANGKVVLCWDDGERSLDLEMISGELVGFSYLNESDTIQDEEGMTDDIERIAVLLTQF